MSSVRILGLGTVVVDHMLILPRFPDQDSKIQVVADRYQVGGPVPTALVVLARLGWPCALIGSWGDDALGRMIDRDLSDEGLDLSPAQRGRGRTTGFAHVWVDQSTGSRTIASSRPSQGIDVRALDMHALQRADALHLDGWPTDAALAAARAVRDGGGRVFLDTGALKPGMRELLQYVDVLNCPRRFLAQLFEDDDPQRGAERLLAMGVRALSVTDGQAGAWWADRQTGPIHHPAVPIEAVDTCSAGDVFTGAVIHGILSGWDGPQVLSFACRTAAASCAELGNRAGLPQRPAMCPTA